MPILFMEPILTVGMAKETRILISEGSSLSSRQTITALGMAGYRADICSDDAFCISRFSRYVGRCYRLPAASKDPGAYLNAILALLHAEKYDVLLPTHEQAFLFAKEQEKIRTLAHIALAPFDAFMKVQSKIASAKLFTKLSLPQPPYRIITAAEHRSDGNNFPAYVKLPYSTAGQGVWRVQNTQELHQLIGKHTWQQNANQLLLQTEATGILCQAQVLCNHGTVVALHCTKQCASGIGNSQSARESVVHPEVSGHLDSLCRDLNWHGPITIDYLYDPKRGPQYIEVNPRLVEPMNATYSGLNLAALTVELSLKDRLPKQRSSKAHVRSHSLMASALGTADWTHSRLHILATCFAAITRTGKFKHSQEDLTPIWRDAYSLLPLSVVLIQLLISPRFARSIANKSIASYSLSSEAIQQILAS